MKKIVLTLMLAAGCMTSVFAQTNTTTEKHQTTNCGECEMPPSENKMQPRQGQFRGDMKRQHMLDYPRTDMRHERLDLKGIDLTEEQKQRLQELDKASNEAMAKEMQKLKEQRSATREQNLKSVLTEEQYQTYLKNQEEAKAARAQRDSLRKEMPKCEGAGPRCHGRGPGQPGRPEGPGMGQPGERPEKPACDRPCCKDGKDKGDCGKKCDKDHKDKKEKCDKDRKDKKEKSDKEKSKKSDKDKKSKK
jgi:Spy/CpxP family protein refolding chaperone